jgi:hypothetical protein
VPEAEDSTGAPSYDQMLDGGALILRRKLDEAAVFCAHKYARELFGIRLPDDKTPEPKPNVDAKVVYAPCHLAGTPDWEAADAAGKQRLLHQCWDKRRTEVPAPTPPPAPPTLPSEPVAPTTP